MRILLILLAGMAASPLSADGASSMLFDVRLLGLRAGVVEIGANVTAKAYAARTRFHTAGMVGVLKRVHADVAVTGRVTDGRLRPQDYSEAIDDGHRATNVQVRFSPGRPRLISGDTGSSAPPADTSALQDAIDPLTLLYVTLRDQPPDHVCQFEADVFDGHRHARITLKDRHANGSTITCNGFYRRIAGYGSDERENRNVAISVTYVQAGDMMRAERVAFDTRLGPAVMNRR